MIGGSPALRAGQPNINSFAAIDLIMLSIITQVIAPCSTYLFRNFQGFIEIFMGGTGITRLIEATAFRLETARRV